VVDVGARERVCRGDSVLVWHTITALRSGLWDADGTHELRNVPANRLVSHLF
jgi:hypothetical protein